MRATKSAASCAAFSGQLFCGNGVLTWYGGSLSRPESLAPALEGIDAVIDAATARPSESVMQVDWEGKVNLIKATKAGWGKALRLYFNSEFREISPRSPDER